MTEIDNRKSPWDEGLNIPWQVVSLDLYRLLCIFHASQSIRKDDSDDFSMLVKEFQESEVGRLLISIAATLRNAQDQNPARFEEWLKGLESDEVGGLISDLDSPSEVKPLGFREALNKIIHCTTINFDYVNEGPKKGDAFLPKVHLYGFYKTNWKATININQFVKTAEWLNI